MYLWETFKLTIFEWLIYIQRHTQVGTQRDTDVQSYMPAGFAYCCSAGVSVASVNQRSGFRDDCESSFLFIVADLRQIPQTPPFLWVKNILSEHFFYCAHVMRTTLLAQGGFLYFSGDNFSSRSGFGIPVQYDLESLFPFHDGDDVWGLCIR